MNFTSGQIELIFGLISDFGLGLLSNFCQLINIQRNKLRARMLGKLPQTSSILKIKLMRLNWKIKKKDFVLNNIAGIL